MAKGSLAKDLCGRVVSIRIALIIYYCSYMYIYSTYNILSSGSWTDYITSSSFFHEKSELLFN